MHYDLNCEVLCMLMMFHKQLPQHDPSLQMVYAPNSISHTVHTHNSTHHSELNTSWSVVPAEEMLAVSKLIISSDIQHLRSCPFYWYLPSWCNVVVMINQITWHSKISNLLYTCVIKYFMISYHYGAECGGVIWYNIIMTGKFKSTSE